MRGVARSLSLCLGLAALAACDRATPVEPVPRPPERPRVSTPQPPARPQATPDPVSLALADYYARVERSLQGKGLLRTDGGGPDTPWDADRLARTFVDLAFFEEYAPDTGILRASQTESTLHRWAAPVRIETRFGRSVPANVRIRDQAEIDSFARRLSAAADHPVGTVERDGNFIVYLVDEAERRALGPELQRLAPGLTPAALQSILDLPQSSYCVVFAIDDSQTGRYQRAVAIVRAEHPDLLRQSCYHEEIAQGLGLANDSPRARPSIFNDDEEFALLTRMDEAMLRMLYDPRLTPGMTLEEARPLLPQIAEGIVAPRS